jgi:hypothetical protein
VVHVVGTITDVDTRPKFVPLAAEARVSATCRKPMPLMPGHYG